MKYAAITDLIQHWEEYEKTAQCPDFKGFAKWLVLKNEPSDQKSMQVSGYEGRSLLALINQFTYKLHRHWEVSAKAIFEQSDQVTSIGEWRVLTAVSANTRPRKSEVIQEAMLELATGTLFIQRLVAKGLIRELPDVEDKRAIRLEITLPGKVVMAEINTQMKPLLQTNYQALTESEIMTLANLLALLDKQAY